MCCTDFRLLVLLFWCIFLRICAIALLTFAYQIFCKPQMPKIIRIILSTRFFCQTKVNLILLPCICVTKYCPTFAFMYIFSLFCAVPLLIYPAAPIRTHFWRIKPTHPLLCLHHMHMTFWGNFPATRPKTMCCISIYMHACLVFLFAHTPVPYRTHLHPFAPICTHQNIKLYCISVLYMLI